MTIYLLALLFLGTWPALLTLLERRGRLPQHSYLDYTLTNFLAAILIAFTFGQIGRSSHEAPNFLFQLSQALPLVSTFWGVLLFGEYRKSSRRTCVLLASMLLIFIAAVGVLMASSGHQKS